MTLEEMVESFDRDLIGWKQNKKKFCLYFKRNVSKKYVLMITKAWSMLSTTKKKTKIK